MIRKIRFTNFLLSFLIIFSKSGNFFLVISFQTGHSYKILKRTFYLDLLKAFENGSVIFYRKSNHFQNISKFNFFIDLTSPCDLVRLILFLVVKIVRLAKIDIFEDITSVRQVSSFQNLQKYPSDIVFTQNIKNKNDIIKSLKKKKN